MFQRGKAGGSGGSGYSGHTGDFFLQQKTRKSAHQKVTVNVKYLAKKKKKDFKRNLGPCYVGENASVWAH